MNWVCWVHFMVTSPILRHFMTTIALLQQNSNVRTRCIDSWLIPCFRTFDKLHSLQHNVEVRQLQRHIEAQLTSMRHLFLKSWMWVLNCFVTRTNAHHLSVYFCFTLLCFRECSFLIADYICFFFLLRGICIIVTYFFYRIFNLFFCFWHHGNGMTYQ